MNFTAFGQRLLILSCSCRKDAGGSTIRLTSRTGFSSASRTVYFGFWLSLVMKLPCTWQARMRSSSMTGVLEASESSKASSTALTMLGRFGRGSSSHICDFMAKAWVRSCMIEEPSP